MPLTITDEQLRAMEMNEREARIEIACRLFAAQKLDLWPAAEFARLSRAEMEGELRARDIPIYRPTVEDLEQDLRSLERLRQRRNSA